MDLRRRGELPHLVEEDRPPVGLFETSAPLVDGAGEGPPFVAEELAFDQRVGNGRAVDLDKRPLEAGAVFVNRPGDQLLARPRLPVDQDRRVGIGHLGNHPEEILHHPGMADDVRRRRPGTAEEMAEAPVLLLDGAAVDRLGEKLGNRGEHGEFPVQVLHLPGDLVRREHPDDAGVVDDRHAEKGQLRPVQKAAGAGPVQKMDLLPEVRAGHRPAGLRDLARDSFAGLVGHVQSLDIDAVRHIEPGLSRLAIEKGDHPPLHPQPVAHLPQGLLDLLPQFPGLRQDPGDGMQRGQFFEVMDADLLFLRACRPATVAKSMKSIAATN